MMPTVLSHDDPDLASSLLRALETAKTLIYPTDTVYGIGGNPWDERTLERVRSLKERPAEQPFTLHLATVAAIEQYAVIDRRRLALIDQLLPGPFTLLLPASADAPPSSVLGGTVGVRVPDHPLFASIMAQLDRPLFGTSVNRHGEPPLNDINDIIDRFSGVDLIISGPVGLGPSAILDLTESPIRVVRGEIGEAARSLIERL